MREWPRSSTTWSILTGLAAVVFVVSAGTQPLRAAQASPSSRDGRIEGIVVDEQGLAVVGARITLAQGGSVRRSTLSTAEMFRLEGLDPGTYELLVEAGGFESKSVTVDLRNQSSVTLEVRLQTGRVEQQVVVTATRSEQRLGNVPASINVLSAEEIKQSPAVVADDVLRQIPTFSLFRRSSSLSSHPTTQGVSLRGIGPSGVSRTLVLLDSVPFNDPFGGWVYWTRVPLENTERIELVDGPTSNLYGNYAMGGVINIVTSRPARRTIEIKPQYGNLNSPKFDFFASDVWAKFGAAVEGSVFKTDGFPNVVPSEKGLVDNNAAVDFANFNIKLDYNPTGRMSAFLRTGYFRENRDNGKVSTFDGTEEANDTRWKFVNGGVRVVLPDQSDLQARVFADFEKFHSNFLAVPTANPLRSVGRMTLNQTVPTTGVGGMAQWSKALGGKQFFTAGTDWRWVDGESQENALDTAKGLQVVTKRFSGGSQQSLGAFVQDMITPVAKVQVTLSARVDHWRNYNAHNLETTVATGLPTANNKPSLPDRNDTVVSPRVAALYHVTDRVTAWGDFGLGFRAPTLNELYRQFSVGAVLTRPNDQLGPERLKGGELGISLAPARNVTVRTTWFDNRVENPVSNVTIATNLQQRQNLGRTRIWGIQNDVEYRFSQSWRVSAGYLYNQAKVVEFAANPALANNCNGVAGEACFLPQVPTNRGSVRVVYSHPRYVTAAVGVQTVGRQFEDDQNARVVPAAALRDGGYPASTEPGLPKFTLVDFLVSRALGANIDVFFGIQNLFDRQYFAFTQATTVGSPRLVNGGIRIRVSGK